MFRICLTDSGFYSLNKQLELASPAYVGLELRLRRFIALGRRLGFPIAVGLAQAAYAKVAWSQNTLQMRQSQKAALFRKFEVIG